jgi:iron complex outermembrane receptor protein
MDALITLLHEGAYSCVIRKGAEVRTFHKRGVADLYFLLENEPEFLLGAFVADKVVGKGAAALMVLGGVKHVYTDVISTPALDLFKTYGVEVSFSETTDRIVNRTKDGLCPVETLCLDLDSPADMLNEIRQFINNRTNG